jgi:3-hydroxyacyl-[acyl-carrier-protein] dehydratase
MSMQESIAAARSKGPARLADGAWEAEFRFGANDPTFAGHFPGRPILPGAYQLEMVRAAAEWALDCSLGIREVSKAKFLRPILPEETVRMDLNLSKQGDTIRAQARFSVLGQRAGETVLVLWPRE